MNVRCPRCQTVYRVDPAKVTTRVRARCASCPGILTIVPPSDAEPADPARPAAPVSRPFVQPRAIRQPAEPAEPVRTLRPSAPVFRPTPGMPIQTPPPPALDPQPDHPAPSRGAATVERSDEPRLSVALAGDDERELVNPFLSGDPRERARRLARALVSDIIVYQPAKREQALREGTLKQVFEEEIGRSWREYRQQVGEEFATSTSYFTEALNEILAGGEQIF